MEVRFGKEDTRPAFTLRDVTDVDFPHIRAGKAPAAPTFQLDDVHDFTVTTGRPVAGARIDGTDHRELWRHAHGAGFLIDSRK